VYNMRIKTGEHEGVPQYSEVPILDVLVASTPSRYEQLLSQGYEEVEFEFKIHLPLDGPNNIRGGRMMAKLASSKSGTRRTLKSPPS